MTLDCKVCDISPKSMVYGMETQGMHPDWKPRTMCEGFVSWPRNCAAASSLDKNFAWLRIMLAQLRVKRNI